MVTNIFKLLLTITIIGMFFYSSSVFGYSDGHLLFLLMLAGTIGGSFNLSSSNQVIAALLGGMSLFGLTAFFWTAKPNVSI